MTVTKCQLCYLAKLSCNNIYENWTNVESLEFVVVQFSGGIIGTPHPPIYILNETISKIFIEHFNEKRNGMQHSLYYK